MERYKKNERRWFKKYKPGLSQTKLQNILKLQQIVKIWLVKSFILGIWWIYKAGLNLRIFWSCANSHHKNFSMMYLQIPYPWVQLLERENLLSCLRWRNGSHFCSQSYAHKNFPKFPMGEGKIIFFQNDNFPCSYIQKFRENTIIIFTYIIFMGNSLLLNLPLGKLRNSWNNLKRSSIIICATFVLK